VFVGGGDGSVRKRKENVLFGSSPQIPFVAQSSCDKNTGDHILAFRSLKQGFRRAQDTQLHLDA
jgi:hypothetical protein